MAAGLAIAGLTKVAPAAGDSRAIAFYNVNTKENLEVTYKQDGRYIPEAMEQINHMMRDWRRDEATKMDPHLIDLIWELHTQLGSRKPVHLISAYRSHKTNNALRRRGGGQARYSQHIEGKAADIQFPDVSVKQLRNSALIREIGGVGFYPTSGVPFVHVDTGRVRYWPRMPRQELALLFPSGHTKFIPTDGRPLTKRDYKIALAKVRKKNPSYDPATERRPILASFSPNAFPSAFGGNKPAAQTTDVTGSILPPPSRPVGSRTASLQGPNDGAELRMTRPSPAGQDAIAALLEDADHPDLLEYRPTSTLAIWSGGSLTHPDQTQAGYWLMELKVRLTYGFAPQSGGGQDVDTTRFSGPAVNNLFAVRSKDRTAQAGQPFRTALR